MPRVLVAYTTRHGSTEEVGRGPLAAVQLRAGRGLARLGGDYRLERGACRPVRRNGPEFRRERCREEADLKRGVPIAGGMLVAGYVVHRIGRRSGATRSETRLGLPGDRLVPQPMWQSTRAITVEAPPADVWPWIVQMGYPSRRGGWYTPHWLDRLMWRIDRCSTDEIVPGLQQLEVGDVIPDSEDGSVFFTVALVRQDEALVLHSTRHLLRPIRSISFSWAFVVRPLGLGRTRLLIRARAAYDPWWAWPLVELAIGPGDFLNAGQMLRGIKRRAERT